MGCRCRNSTKLDKLGMYRQLNALVEPPRNSCASLVCMSGGYQGAFARLHVCHRCVWFFEKSVCWGWRDCWQSVASGGYYVWQFGMNIVHASVTARIRGCWRHAGVGFPCMARWAMLRAGCSGQLVGHAMYACRWLAGGCCWVEMSVARVAVHEKVLVSGAFISIFTRYASCCLDNVYTWWCWLLLLDYLPSRRWLSSGNGGGVVCNITVALSLVESVTESWEMNKLRRACGIGYCIIRESGFTEF